MSESPRIEGLLRRIRREIRRRRAEYYGLRGAFWGAVAGVVVLLAKHAVGGAAAWAAAALVILGAVAGIGDGAARPVARGDAARGADRAFRLDGRVAATPEGAEPAGPTRPVDSLVAATWGRAAGL